jgi:hypothetical protein
MTGMRLPTFRTTSSSSKTTQRILLDTALAFQQAAAAAAVVPPAASLTTSTSTNPPPPPLVPFPNAMAACLLMFDDNLSLVEWLAYHYHTMPLRHVIVLTDPRSTESPIPILERWQTLGLLTYEYWDETRVFAHDPQVLHDLYQQGDLIQLHRARQGHFYGQCMRELKLRWQSTQTLQHSSLHMMRPSSSSSSAAVISASASMASTLETTATPGTTTTMLRKQQQQQPLFYNNADSNNDNSNDAWVILTDVDEYVTINPRIADSHHKLYRPYQATTSLTQPGTILQFLQQEQRQHKPQACIHMARRDMVSNQESTMEEISVGVPDYIDPTTLFTTRWRYQSHRKITGKCLVNLNHVPYTGLPIQTPKQGHVPLAHGYCPHWYAKQRYTMNDTPLVVHHYLGTQEQYQHRDDPRRDRTNAGFDSKQQYPTSLQDDTRTWLQGFIDQVGKDIAVRLLQGAGEGR